MKPPTRRCAVYTRKSSEEGLDQDFNSLDAQRESCFAYIASQKSEGWNTVKDHYDDGGFSGGNMERPALKKLLDDIKAGKVHIVVVYKIDRLTRSLMDFAKLVEVFDKYGVTFVSVTQSFNTTTSMGRLTLNVLLSFAQFEREVTGERIRDKIAASKKKGMWMGGVPPLGYKAENKKLIIVPEEAKTARLIFRRYLELQCVRKLNENLAQDGIRSRTGKSFSRGCLYKLLSNPVYIGKIRHKDICHDGKHEGIIDQDLWDQVQKKMADNVNGEDKKPRSTEKSPLAGKLFDETGASLTPSHANKKGKRYRYYLSKSLVTGTKDKNESGWRLPAPEIENLVTEAAQAVLDDHPAITESLREAGVDAINIPAALKAAIAQSKKLASVPDRTEALAAMVQRVDLGRDSMRLSLLLASMIGQGDTKNTVLCPTITREIPVRIQRRGVEMKLVIAGGDTARIDPVLIKAVARARIWFEELQSGTAKSFQDIASRYEVSDGYVGHLLPLAFLAPDIVEAIVAGQQPAELTTDALIKRINLPTDWSEQRRILGFN
ncbi:MAG: recombinase family protein [Proteobacteria bacterium]|nr:recombinase family protein [Pseudomonadota bacterium]